MKKFIWLFLCSILFISCDDFSRGKSAVEAKTEDGKEYLDINGRRYFKIKVFDHDAYQCIFDTHGSWGSDIIHFYDRCDFCKKHLKDYKNYTSNTDLIN